MQLGSTITATGTSFRVWAPQRRTVDVEFTDSPFPSLALSKDAAGYFSGHSTEARHRTQYRFCLDKSERHADPYSRFQPDGPMGPSMVIDPDRFEWHDQRWEGLDPCRQVVYELHVGTFTSRGDYAGTAEQLGALRNLGVTAIEVMPVNEFVGRFGWGYDGVNWFAPYHHYGDPDDLRRLVDRAHQMGIGVILDVVYNHFGSFGNFLPRFAAEYLDHEMPNPWGGAPNYRCDAMRRLAIDNAVYWIREFHMDGLRLDATQNIHDPQHPTLLAALAAESRAAAAPRSIVISGEDYLQRAHLLAGTERGGPRLDQLWNDDFHHASRVAVTGNHGGYFEDYRGRSQELLSAMRHGYLFQGQYSKFAKGPRGSPSHTEPAPAFVVFTQNHDQTANTLFGERLHKLTSPGKSRAITAALLLGPNTPLLFMGQEFDASTPFAYFADYDGETAAQLWRGRRNELLCFEQYADAAAQDSVFEPCSIDTVRRSTLDFGDRERNAATLRLYRDLLHLRQHDAVLDIRPQVPFDGSTLNESAFLLRWFAPDECDRLLLVNLGARIEHRPLAEALLAPPAGKRWRVTWSSNHPRYGGYGSVAPLRAGFQMDAESAVFLIAEAASNIEADA